MVKGSIVIKIRQSFSEYIWKDIFRISQTENLDFDINNEQYVTNYLREHRDMTEPYDTSDLNRLIAGDPLLKPIET